MFFKILYSESRNSIFFFLLDVALPALLSPAADAEESLRQFNTTADADLLHLLFSKKTGAQELVFMKYLTLFEKIPEYDPRTEKDNSRFKTTFFFVYIFSVYIFL